MGGFRASHRAIFAFLFVGGISAASAGTVTIEELSAAQFASVFGSPKPTFNGITVPGAGYIYEATSLVVGSVTYDDQGNGDLFVEGMGQSYDIGTGNTLLVDEFPNNSAANINMTFASPVSVIGLVVGDAFGAGGHFGHQRYRQRQLAAHYWRGSPHLL
jgi:hypothetical protein